MKNNYIGFRLQLFSILVITVLAASCKKDSAPKTSVTVTPVTLPLIEYGTTQGKRVFIPITKVGDQTVNYYSVFDTGSSGMTIDANGILPASMITSAGITVAGDSVVVNGITVTSKKATISFGDKTSLTKQYGNLAYAPITIGDSHGNLSIKRIPIFLYYKVTDVNGKQLAVHANDVFGVGPGTSYSFSAITSPLRAFTTGGSVSSGFKMAIFNSTYFTSTGTYVPGLLTIGLTSSDLSSSGFIMHPLAYFAAGGYSPNIPGTITYNNKTIAAELLFDTGTPSVTIIEDQTASSLGNLPDSSLVKLTTTKGFSYQYLTKSTSNLTAIQNPNNSGDFRTIFSIDFFIKNEMLIDYTNHQIGLKNN
ncbi:MAG TPA: hypothetical protein VK668_01900 [Mucilaginibacter sp.]|nr:hypothetical protein [Mucilaginibacter sp.]